MPNAVYCRPPACTGAIGFSRVQCLVCTFWCRHWLPSERCPLSYRHQTSVTGCHCHNSKAVATKCVFAAGCKHSFAAADARFVVTSAQLRKQEAGLQWQLTFSLTENNNKTHLIPISCLLFLSTVLIFYLVLLLFLSCPFFLLLFLFVGYSPDFSPSKLSDSFHSDRLLAECFHSDRLLYGS